jgi:hypothetical protein
VADGAVAVAGAALRLEHRVVERQRAAGVGRDRADHARQPRLGALAAHQRRGGDGAGVDHRVHRPAGVRLEADRVERVARGLDADLAPHRLGALVLEGDAVDQRLGDRLDRERPARVADLVDLAVDGGDGDAEPGGVGLGQLGDVAGDLAAAQALKRAWSSSR